MRGQQAWQVSLRKVCVCVFLEGLESPDFREPVMETSGLPVWRGGPPRRFYTACKYKPVGGRQGGSGLGLKVVIHLHTHQNLIDQIIKLHVVSLFLKWDNHTCAE